MCGLAGILHLASRGEPDPVVVQRMTETLHHRGPDEDGYLFGPGFGIGHRRLSIVGLSDGAQPIFNEDRTVGVIFNGELFDYPERRAALEAKGHVFRTRADTEIIVHLYEEHQEAVFEHLNGQFAVAIVDFRLRRVLLARDRVGICPLYLAKQGDRLFFGSEIKSLLASGAIAAACDPRGLDHIFTFFGYGGQRTAFAGVEALLPGHYLKVELPGPLRQGSIGEHRYWDLDFPDAGDEIDTDDAAGLTDQFEEVFRRSVEIRLRADVPVVGYLSGGVDSAYVLAMASKIRGTSLPSFTIRIDKPKLDESANAAIAARHIGSATTTVTCDGKVITEAFPKLVAAADSPVMDTSCAALWCLSREVHNQGYKVALTGEGADEAFAGYVWFKLHELGRSLRVAGFAPDRLIGRGLRKLYSPNLSWRELKRIDDLIGGPHDQSELYNFVASSRHRYYSAALKDQLGAFTAYEDLPLDLDRMRRWHPLNQSLYLGYKIHLAGHLLQQKGDRVSMANSVETRYPFLDQDLIAFAAGLHPRWKIRRPFQDKYLLRLAAARVLPASIALRPKAMFRAPFAESFFATPPAFVRQLMSHEALSKTGYFDVAAVRRDYERIVSGRLSPARFFSSMGLAGVLSTQLWHHLYLGDDLCDLPRHGPLPDTQHATASGAAQPRPQVVRA